MQPGPCLLKPLARRSAVAPIERFQGGTGKDIVQPLHLIIRKPGQVGKSPARRLLVAMGSDPNTEGVTPIGRSSVNRLMYAMEFTRIARPVAFNPALPSNTVGFHHSSLLPSGEMLECCWNPKSLCGQLVLAISDEVTIRTTKGGIRLDADGRHNLRSRQPVGSRIECLL